MVDVTRWDVSRMTCAEFDRRVAEAAKESVEIFKGRKGKRRKAQPGGTPLHDGAAADHKPVPGICDHPDERDTGKAASVSAEQRRQLAAEGKALPDGSYPVPDVAHLEAAIVLAQSGHGDVAAAKRLIVRRARELGRQDLIPDGWGSTKALSPEAFAELLAKARGTLAHGHATTPDRGTMRLDHQGDINRRETVTLHTRERDPLRDPLGSSLCMPASATVEKLDLSHPSGPDIRATRHGLTAGGYETTGMNPDSSTSATAAYTELTGTAPGESS